MPCHHTWRNKRDKNETENEKSSFIRKRPPTKGTPSQWVAKQEMGGTVNALGVRHVPHWKWTLRYGSRAPFSWDLFKHSYLEVTAVVW
jgi:hypothetical protein